MDLTPFLSIERGYIMQNFKITLENETGLHARPASMLVDLAKKFESEIKIIKDGNEHNAKSMMSVLSMGAEKGTTLEFTFDGSDAKKASSKIKKLIKNNFDE